MDCVVVPDIRIEKKNSRRVGAFWYNKEDDALYHESPWPFPVKLLIRHDLSECVVTPGFVKLPFILKGWINLDILLREIELLKMLEMDQILMHGSCVNNTLIVGFPNSGKTYQTYRAVADGAELISEEYTIIEKDPAIRGGYKASAYKNMMRTCFSARTIRDCNIEVSLKEKMWLAMTTLRAKIMPFMFEAVIWKELPASGNTAVIKKIVHGSTGQEVKDWKTFAILCENEFPFMSSEFLQAYAVATGYDLLGRQEKQRRLIKEFVSAVYPSPL